MLLTWGFLRLLPYGIRVPGSLAIGSHRHRHASLRPGADVLEPCVHVVGELQGYRKSNRISTYSITIKDPFGKATNWWFQTPPLYERFNCCIALIPKSVFIPMNGCVTLWTLLNPVEPCCTLWTLLSHVMNPVEPCYEPCYVLNAVMNPRYEPCCHKACCSAAAVYRFKSEVHGTILYFFQNQIRPMIDSASSLYTCTLK